jgi:hypothetical protein
MTRLEEFKVSSSDTEPDLEHQIQTLEEAVPELRSPSPAASATVVPPSGTKGLVHRLVEVHHTRTSLDHLSQSTAVLERNLAREIRDNRASMRPVMSQLQALTADPSPNGSLTEGQRAFRDLLQRNKQLGAVALALREESAVVRRFVGDLETWKSALGREGWLILQNLGIGLIGVVIALAAILVGGALWRVAAERYVQDTYRRRLLLIARKVVVGTAMALVLVFHFASELTTLITGLGFAAAGIAFALQTVILALAGYFSMVAPNGIRVGIGSACKVPSATSRAKCWTSGSSGFACASWKGSHSVPPAASWFSPTRWSSREASSSIRHRETGAKGHGRWSEARPPDRVGHGSSERHTRRMLFC